MKKLFFFLLVIQCSVNLSVFAQNNRGVGNGKVASNSRDSGGVGNGMAAPNFTAKD